MNRMRQPGFTLVEILVVIALISILLGVGSAFFTHFDRKLILQTTAGQIATLVKSSQNLARVERNSVRVTIAPQQGYLEVWGSTLVGCWHFEDLVTTGAFARDGKAQGVSVTEGKVGKALEFSLGTGKVDCGALAGFNLKHGLRLSFWVYPKRPPQDGIAQILCQVGSFYTLGILGDQTVYVEAQGQKFPTGYLLPLYQWTHLELLDDYASLTVTVGHTRRKRLASPKFSPQMTDLGSLLLGKMFQGKVDEVRLSALAVQDSFTLPEGIVFTTAPPAIIFDGYGRLDPLHHVGSQTILLQGKVLERLEQIGITISLLGEVEVLPSERK